MCKVPRAGVPLLEMEPITILELFLMYSHNSMSLILSFLLVSQETSLERVSDLSKVTEWVYWRFKPRTEAGAKGGGTGY